MSALQKNKSTQTNGSVFAEKKEEAKKTNIEMEIIKDLHCFFDGHGTFESILVSFKIKSLKQTQFFVTVSKGSECSQRRQNAS